MLQLVLALTMFPVYLQCMESAAVLTFTLSNIPYSRKIWRGIYFGGLAVLRAIRKYFQTNITTYNIPLYVTSSICGHRRSKCPHESFKLWKNGTKIVQIWSTISRFQRGLMCYGSKRTQQCLHYTNRSGMLHLSPFAMNIQ